MDSQPGGAPRRKGRRSRFDPLKTARRVGFGEYYDPATGDGPRIMLQTGFLARVEKLAPEVLLGLQLDVLPLYRGLPEQRSAPPTLVDGAMRYGWEEACAQRRREDPAIAQFCSATEEWAKRFDIAAGWVYDRAIATLRAWNERGPGSSFAGMQMSFGTPLLLEEFEFAFTTLGWHPTQEQAAHFEARVRKAFDESLLGYVADLTERYRTWGRQRAPAVPRAPETQFQRFDWLVQWQIKHMTIPAIVRGAGSEGRTAVAPRGSVPPAAEKRVKRGLREAAKEIGLVLRKGLPGRPRK